MANNRRNMLMANEEADNGDGVSLPSHLALGSSVGVDGDPSDILEQHRINSSGLLISQQIPHREKEKRNRKRKSEIWDWFVLIDNSSAVRCTKCGWSIKYSGSTSGCHEHSKKCHGIRSAKMERGCIAYDQDVLDGSGWGFNSQCTNDSCST